MISSGFNYMYMYSLEGSSRFGRVPVLIFTQLFLLYIPYTCTCTHWKDPQGLVGYQYLFSLNSSCYISHVHVHVLIWKGPQGLVGYQYLFFTQLFLLYIPYNMYMYSLEGSSRFGRVPVLIFTQLFLLYIPCTCTCTHWKGPQGLVGYQYLFSLNSSCYISHVHIHVLIGRVLKVW